MTPNLRDYHVILLNSSAGKDSQAMIDYVHGLAVEQHVHSRLVVVHADLGRSEWKGTRELAERQAHHYHIPFRVVSKERDLLQQVQDRGKWPDNKNRYCTSDQKRNQIYKVMTALVRGLTAEDERRGDPIRILNCMGLRAQESPARAKKKPFEFDKMASNGRRHVDRWLPIHDWTTDQVWERIRASGVEHHGAYDLGMKRLSCVFCIFSPRSQLVLAGHHNPELLAQYVEVETAIGHTFRKNLTLLSVQQEVQSTPLEVARCAADQDDGCWNM